MVGPQPDESVHKPIAGETTAARTWEIALGELQLQMACETFDTWLRGSRLLKYEDGVFVVGVASVYAVEWLEARLLPVVERTLRRLTGRDETRVRFVAATQGRGSARATLT